MRNFIGRDGFTWFVGVVEDRNDPVKIGRLRVRAFGYHTDKKSEIKTEDLPWAQVVNGVQSSSLNGLGNSPTGIVEGSWVVGFFIDGERAQEPVIIGTLPGIPSESPDTTKGFNDPNGVYPKSIYLNESDVNRLSRGVQTRIYTPDPKIGEPDDPYAAEYPKNHVMETESGHIKEYDDTPDHERIREIHKSGTFYEIHPDGSIVTHVVKNGYRVVVGNDSVHVKGNVLVYVDGDSTINISKNATMNVGGDWDVNVNGNITMDASTINLNNGTEGAARIGDTADTGDAGGAVGSNEIETGSGTVFIGG